MQHASDPCCKGKQVSQCLHSSQQRHCASSCVTCLGVCILAVSVLQQRARRPLTWPAVTHMLQTDTSPAEPITHPHGPSLFETPVPKDVCASVQGQAQCCVTGPAFQHMLQQDDLSVVETVMRNVVVFARMRSHQKGQVMDLLGERGLHQVFKGQPRHVPVSTMIR